MKNLTQEDVCQKWWRKQEGRLSAGFHKACGPWPKESESLLYGVVCGRWGGGSVGVREWHDTAYHIVLSCRICSCWAWLILILQRSRFLDQLQWCIWLPYIIRECVYFFPSLPIVPAVKLKGVEFKRLSVMCDRMMDIIYQAKLGWNFVLRDQK